VAVKAHWKGKDGQFLNGVPARSLSDDEYAALDKEQRAAVRDSGLYRMEEDKPPARGEKGEGG
jgi:hypothetical protein